MEKARLQLSMANSTLFDFSITHQQTEDPGPQKVKIFVDITLSKDAMELSTDFLVDDMGTA